MKKQKPIMRAYVPISREGRFLLTVIFMLAAISLVGITFIIKGQEAQGEMLNQTMKASEQLQATVDAIQAEVSADELIGTFKATAYCAGFGDGCPVCGTNGITSTGTKCSPVGSDLVTIAVDPRVIPYGTKLKIVYPDGSIIFGLAEDTGGFAGKTTFGTYQIDVCYANHEEALQRGVKQVKVYAVKGE